MSNSYDEAMSETFIKNDGEQITRLEIQNNWKGQPYLLLRPTTKCYYCEADIWCYCDGSCVKNGDGAKLIKECERRDRPIPFDPWMYIINNSFSYVSNKRLIHCCRNRKCAEKTLKEIKKDDKSLIHNYRTKGRLE